MDIQTVQEFVVLADICNYARAAEELYTTQATLSRHIISLEKELGKPLFNRTTRRVTLTEFGEGFLQYAERLLDVWEECKAYLLNEREESTHITVALSEPILTDIAVKNVFLNYSLENPDYSLEIVNDDDEERLIERLRRHECDLIVLREPQVYTDNFQRVAIMPPEPLCVLLRKDAIGAEQTTINLSELRDATFLLPPSYSYTYKLFLERCRQIGFDPKLKNALRGRDIASKMAYSGVGIPVLSKLPANNIADDNVRVVEINPPILQQVNLIYPQLRKQSPAIDALIKCFKKYTNTSIFRRY